MTTLALRDRLRILVNDWNAKHPHASFRQNMLSKHCGVSPASVNKWFNGETHNMSSSSLSRVASFFGASYTWVAEGKGDRYPKAPAATAGRSFFDDVVFTRKEEMMAVKVMATLDHGVAESEELRYLPVSIIESRGLSQDDVFAVRMADNSMDKVIPAGSLVVINNKDTDIKSGEIYAINHNEYLRIALLYKSPGSKGLRIRHYNDTEYPPEDYDEGESSSITVLGRAIFWQVSR